MRLYRIKTEFWNDNEKEKALLGYVVANSEDKVVEYINQKYHRGGWFTFNNYDNSRVLQNEASLTKQDYLTNKGDFHTEHVGEYYDQKYGWEEVGEVTDEQIATLFELGILEKVGVS